MKLDGEKVERLFERYLKSRSYSENTLRRYRGQVRGFCEWLREERGIEDLREVGKGEVVGYMKYISEEKKGFKEGRRYSVSTRRGMVSVLKVLFRYLTRNEYVLRNPIEGMEVKIQGEERLRRAMSEGEMKRLLESIEPRRVYDLRDRCIFELMYGTGMRVSEVVKLDVTDIDMERGKVYVREGKGRKERVIGVGRKGIGYVKEYLERGRGKLKGKGREESEALFLAGGGRRIKSDQIRNKLKKRLREAGIEREGISPHVLRHSFATHMVENGATLKHVKEQLGHKSIQTTVVYTHFSVRSLKKIMKERHPRENELYEECEYREEEVERLTREEERID